MRMLFVAHLLHRAGEGAGVAVQLLCFGYLALVPVISSVVLGESEAQVLKDAVRLVLTSSHGGSFLA